LLRLHDHVGEVCEVDAFRRMRPRVDWHDRRLHSLALQSAALSATALAVNNASPVVLVDCFCRDTAPTTAALIAARSVFVLTLSLWAESSTLADRMLRRVNDYSDTEMARLMNEEVRTRRVNDTLIDTTHLAPEQVAAQLQEALCR